MSLPERAPAPAIPRSALALAAAAAALLLALLVVGMAHFRGRRAERLRHEQAKLAAIAALKVDELAAWRRERLLDAEGLAESPTLAHWLPVLARGDAAPELAEWLEGMRARHGYHSIFLYSADGRRLLASGPDDLGLDEVDRHAVQAVRDGAPFLSDLHGQDEARRAGAPAPHLDVAAPVRGARRAALGAVLIQIDPASMLDPLHRWPIPSATSELLLVRQEGQEVLLLSRPRSQPGSATALRVPVSRAESPEVHAALGERSAMEGRDYRGAQVVAAVRPVPGSDWGLVAKEDAAEAYAPLQREVALGALALLLLAATGASGILLWWRGQSTAVLRTQLAAERERRALRERVDALFLQSNDVMALVDEEGRILEANDRATEVWQLSREQLIGQDFRVVRVPEERGRSWGELVGEADRLVYETCHRRADGSTFPVEVSVRALALDGRRYYQCTLRDITRRKLQERALRESEERLAYALDAADDGIWDWSLEDDALYLSPGWHRMLGYAQGEVRRIADAWALVHPDDAPELRRRWDRTLSGEAAALSCEYRVRARDGAWRWVLTRGKVVARGEGGRPLRFVGTNTDMTEKRQLQSRLMLADRLASLGTLSAGVAHEINNPLAYVISNLGYARRALERAVPAGAAGPLAEVAPALAEAAEGCERIRLIVRDLKTFSRADDEPRGPADVQRVLLSALNLAGNDLRQRATLVKELGPVPRVDASEARLGQVFLNLLLNAAQALPAASPGRNQVRVTARTDAAGRAVVEVADNGPGIAPALLGRVFDPFFTTKQPGEGTGLGLSICHGIVSEMGGTIEVESETGQGALFRVTLPPSRSGEAAPEPDAAAEAARSQRAVRMLVVDDEPRLAESYQRLLAPEFAVTAATSGRSALELIRGGDRFDVVLCDLMMPEMTGMELHAEVEAVAPELARRMIFVTGGAFTAQAREFLAQVRNPRIEKPFRREALEELVASVVGGR